MVKRRGAQDKLTCAQPTDAQIEACASAADGAVSSVKDKNKTMNPTAVRDYKSIRVPFNQYEYCTLEDVAKKTGRTKLNVIRWAILKLADGGG